MCNLHTKFELYSFHGMLVALDQTQVVPKYLLLDTITISKAKPVLTMTLTSIKAVKPLHATTRPKNLAMLP